MAGYTTRMKRPNNEKTMPNYMKHSDEPHAITSGTGQKKGGNYALSSGYKRHELKQPPKTGAPDQLDRYMDVLKSGDKNVKTGKKTKGKASMGMAYY